MQKRKEVCRTSKSKFENNYRLITAVHTLQIKTANSINYEALRTLLNKKVVKRYTTCADNKTKHIILNLNKINNVDIVTFDEFKKNFEETMALLEVKDYSLMRVDLKLDSPEKAFFQEFAKIHLYLLLGMSQAYAVDNRFQSYEPISRKELSTAIKNEYFQAEFYNRNRKNIITKNAMEIAQARLELRSTSRAWRTYRKKSGETAEILYIEEEFTRAWVTRIRKAIDNLDKVQEQCNAALLEKWQQGYRKFPITFRNTMDFLAQNQTTMFTRKQLISLLSQTGCKSPEKSADNFILRYRPELFSEQDINAVVREIKRSINKFFGI